MGNVSLFVYILLINIYPILSDESAKCSLIIGKNRFSSLYGINALYNNEVVDDSYKTDSQNIHQTPIENDIEFLFTSELIDDTSSYKDIQIEVISNNTAIASPKINIIKSDKIVNKMLHREIEVIYNCNELISGLFLITLKVKNENCSPFELSWIKNCGNKTQSNIPNVSLGILKSSNIINNGQIQETNKHFLSRYFDNFIPEHIISDGVVPFFISSKENLNVENFVLSSNSPQYVNSFLFGEITKGGSLNEKEKMFYVLFTCIGESELYSNIQIDIPFEKKQVISLYFIKRCPPITRLNFIQKIWWLIKFIACIVILTFFGILVHFKFIDREINITNLKEFFRNINEKVKWFINEILGSETKENYKKDINIPRDFNSKETESNEANEDEAFLNVKITSKSESNTNKEYGGV